MIIVKVGGSKNLNWDYIAKDLKKILENEQVVLVHGASQIRDEVAEQLGYPTQTVVSPSGVSSVFTDEKAIEIFLMSYAGLVNKRIVSKFQSVGINAIGLSGLDGRLWEGKQKNQILVKEDGKVKVKQGNLTGRVERINTDLVKLLLTNNYVPVICPPAISYENQIINVDNDLAIAVMARELGIEKIVVLFEAKGLLRDANDPDSIIREVPKNEIEEYYQFAQGRMKKKIMGAKEALDGGVKEVLWGDSRVERPVTKALNGEGTVIS